MSDTSWMSGLVTSSTKIEVSEKSTNSGSHRKLNPGLGERLVVAG